MDQRDQRARQTNTWYRSADHRYHGPTWQGTLPQGITQQVKSPTNSVFIIGRVYAEATAEDYAAVNALQKDFKLIPLSTYGKPYSPPAGTIDPNAPSVKEIVRNVINAMDTQTYFNMLAKSMAVNPPALPEDAPIVAEMAKIGLVPGKPFDLSKLAPDVQRALADVGKSAYALIAEQQKKGGKTVNKLTVSPRDNPTLNTDGSLDLYFSHEKPSERSAGKLAARTSRPIHPYATDVLAKRDTTFDPRRHVVPSASEKGGLSHAPIAHWSTGSSFPENRLRRTAQ